MASSICEPVNVLAMIVTDDRPENHVDARTEDAIARPVRQRTTTLQSPLSGKPASLPDPGTRIWWVEVGEREAAGERMALANFHKPSFRTSAWASKR